MDPEDEMWKRLADKLADEATEDELRELDQLLRQNPALVDSANRIAAWWQYDEGQERYDDRLFEKVLARIR